MVVSDVSELAADDERGAVVDVVDVGDDAGVDDLEGAAALEVGLDDLRDFLRRYAFVGEAGHGDVFPAGTTVRIFVGGFIASPDAPVTTTYAGTVTLTVFQVH